MMDIKIHTNTYLNEFWFSNLVALFAVTLLSFQHGYFSVLFFCTSAELAVSFIESKLLAWLLVGMTVIDRL